MYDIKERQFQQARKYNVEIKPSTSKSKKIDVFKGDKKVASIGANGYKDYATYIQEIGKKEADKRRKNYLARHSKEAKQKDGVKTNSYYADVILWG